MWVVLKAALLGLILWYVFRDTHWADLKENLLAIPLWAFPAIGLVQVVLQCLQAWRWRMLITTKIPYKIFMGYISMGYVLSMVSPSVVLSDGIKSYLLGKRNRNLLDSMSSMLLARLTGLFVLLCFFVVLFPAHRWVFQNLQFQWQKNTWVYFVILLSVMIVGIVVYVKRRSDVHKVVSSFKMMLNDPGKICKLFSLSFGIQIVQILFIYLVYRFSGAQLTYVEVMFLAPLITFISLIPLTIGQVGVREGLSVFFFTLYPGVDKEHVLAAAAFNYGLMILFGVANVGLAYYFLKTESRIE